MELISIVLHTFIYTDLYDYFYAKKTNKRENCYILSIISNTLKAKNGNLTWTFSESYAALSPVWSVAL